MRRNCNLELQLLTPSLSFADHHSVDMEGESTNKSRQPTIFYKGQVVPCDATELQARAIISLAIREMEEKKPSKSSPAAVLNSPVYFAATGLSMKRSVQRFLEKRKSRGQSKTPYQVTRQ